MKLRLAGRSIVVSVVLSLAMLLAFVPAPVARSTVQPVPASVDAALSFPHIPGELIIRFKNDTTEEERKEALASGGLIELQSFNEINAKLVETAAEDLAYVLAELNIDPRVAYAEPNFLMSIDQIPNDPEYPLQWGLDNTGQIINGTAGIADADIDAPEAWEITTGSPEVIVAVIDSGVNFSHPDFGANNRSNSLLWQNSGELCPGCSTDGLDNDGNGYIDDWRGWDFVNLDENPHDDNGHGTHVAGIIAARGNNGEGGVGIAPNVTIMSIKAFGAGGGGTSGGTVGSVLYAANHGAHIINASWGGIAPSISLEEAVDYAGQQGVLFVAAGGNDGFDTDLIGHFPSGLDLNSLISVGATNNRDELADFSNYGLKSVDIGAPGEDVYSTWVREDITLPYRYASGTSMAAPHVTGVAALIKSHFPNATPLGIKNLIFNTADKKESLDGLVSTGARVNAFNAVICSNEPQVWIDRPVPGFAAVPGEPVDVRILGSNCAVPDGITVTASAGGQAFELTAQGGGLYTGTFVPTAAGVLIITAEARLGEQVDSHQVTGESVLNYRFQNDAFNWLDATGGEQITFDDERDFQVDVPLSFPFTFYNRTFEELTIGENGLVGFGGTRVTSAFNQEIPDILAPNGFIAAHWDNLDLEDGGEIWYDTLGTAPDRQFVISWVDIPNNVVTSGITAGPGPFNGITFQIVLEETMNHILLQYLDADAGLTSVDYGTSATIGVEHFSGTVGRQFSYNEDSLREYEGTTAIRLSLRDPLQPEILTRSLANVSAGQPYVQQLAADGGAPPYAWSIVEGGLPEGVILDPSTGYIGGTAYQPGTYTITVELTDANGTAVRQFFEFDVAAGYEWMDGEFEWIDPTGGEQLPFERDDQAFTRDLPFTFNYFGQPFDQFQISSNGYVAFSEDRATSFINTNLPNPRAPNGTVAVFWDDLSPQDGGSVWMSTVGEAPDRKVVVSWVEVPRFKEHFAGTFQVIFEEGSNDIVMQYLDLDFGDPSYDFGASATIGIENPDGTIGLVFSVDDQIPEEYIGQTAIRFTSRGVETPEINTESLADAQFGAHYFDLLSARGGDPPFSWSIVEGSLPSGLNLDPGSGTISGEPVETGLFSFTAEATDSGNPAQLVSGEFSINVLPSYDVSDGPYGWIDGQAGGTRIEYPGDDSAELIELPFSFEFYSETFSDVQVGTNGYLVFGGSRAQALRNRPIPNPDDPNGLVSVLWDDLDPDEGQGVWVRVVGEAPNRQFVATWIDAARFNRIGAATFQVILEEGSNRIIFQYQDVVFDDERYDYGASATIGLESLNGTIGIQFSFDKPVLEPYEGQRSIVFTPVE
ncbi:hypothetical protein BH23CHL2_BH23CHL2_26180 [soil metagenome]